MRKIISLIFVVLLVFLFIYFNQSNPSQTQILEDLSSPLKPPYTVSTLNSKVNSNNIITVEKEVTKQSGFASYLISYTSENLKQFALMLVPSGQKPESGWPVVIVNHGYIPPENYSTINSYRNTSAYYANQGFLVLKPDYRGHDQSEGESNILFARSQYSVDVLNLINAINSIPEADPDNIYMYGHSMGGEVSLQVIQNTDKIKGITLWAPAVADYPESVMHFLNKRRPKPTDYDQIKTDIANLVDTFGGNEFSSLTYLSKINIPILVHHGTADESVPFSWGENLVTKLKDNNKTVTFYSYQNDNHDIARNFSTVLSRDVQFFRSEL